MVDVVVVGAGVFGAWTAHHLRAAGARVSLIDAYGAAHPRSSSGDHSRILRCGYGADEIYARMAWRSRQQWLELERRHGVKGERRIWHPCGVLWIAAAGDPYAAATRKTLQRCALPFEVLDDHGLRERVPHLNADDLTDVMLEPECGALSARRAVRLLVTELSQGGVAIVHGRVQTPHPGRVVAAVQLGDGSRVTGERFVFACGAWLPAIFPDILAGRIRPTRQTVVYFGSPSGSDLFKPTRTPAWVDFPAGIYGVPDLDDRGLKVGIDEHGPPIDPDSDDRIADRASIARARGWLSHRFPAMREAPVIEARVCQYENTSTGDFLIDRHPIHDNVWIVGGGSGHGFKHGPAVGEYAAKMVLTGEAPEPRFTLTAKTADARRVVY